MNSIYSKDWYNRNENFIHESSTSRFGWELNDDSYSSFLYNEDKANLMMSSKKELRKELISIIKAIGVPSTSLIITDEEDTAYTNGKFIVVTNNLSNKYDDNYKNIDAIIGMTIHECCHLLYTDFAYIEEIIKKNKYNKLAKYVQNLLEDEIIEEKITTKFPGYGNFLGKLKYNIFGLGDIQYKLEDIKKDNNEYITALMNVLLCCVRYPKYLTTMDNDVLEYMVEDITKIKSIIKSWNCFNIEVKNCTFNTMGAGNEIFAYLSNKYGKDPLNDLDLTNPNTYDNNTSEKSNENEINDINNRINKKKVLDESYYDEWKENYESKSDVIAQNISTPTSTDINKYNMIYNTVKRYSGLFKDILVPSYSSINITERFQRNGRLDTSIIANAIQGHIRNIYIRNIQKQITKSSKFAFVIMLDESGSMDVNNILWFSTQLAILLYETLSKNKDIELYIYGHGDLIVPYVDKKINNKYALASRQSQCSQDEVSSYRNIIDIVKSQTNLPIIALNITDSAYISNIDEIKNIVAELNKENVTMSVASICCEYISDRVIKLNNDIYGEGNYIYLKDMSNFSVKYFISNVGKVLSKMRK